MTFPPTEQAPFQPTTQGPRMVRHAIKDRLYTALPLLLPVLRGQWARAAAFPPPADSTGNDTPLPPADGWWTYSGRPVDRWPIIQVALGPASVKRGGPDQLTVDGSYVDFVTYQANVYVWTLLEVPAAVETDQREWVVDQRDDMVMAIRSVILEKSIAPKVRAMQNTFTEEYGDPEAGAGQRWNIASRARFTVWSQESRSPVPIVGPNAPDRDIEVEVIPLPAKPLWGGPPSVG